MMIDLRHVSMNEQHLERPAHAGLSIARRAGRSGIAYFFLSALLSLIFVVDIAV